MAPRIDFRIADNAPFTGMFVFTDENGTSDDFTGSTFKLQVKAADASGNPTGSVLLTLTTGSGIAGTLASGEWRPTFPKPSANSMPVSTYGYVYDCLRLSASVAVETLCYGSITIFTGVTS